MTPSPSDIKTARGIAFGFLRVPKNQKGGAGLSIAKKWAEVIATALAAQRERDAKIADEHCKAESHQWQPDKCQCPKRVATAIRQGGEG